MACNSCKSERIVSVSAKCSDCFGATCYSSNQDYDGYVPSDLAIGGGDYVRFSYCLDCGKIQGKFPLPESKIEIKGETDE